jgi:hypothetical protein
MSPYSAAVTNLQALEIYFPSRQYLWGHVLIMKDMNVSYDSSTPGIEEETPVLRDNTLIIIYQKFIFNKFIREDEQVLGEF